MRVAVGAVFAEVALVVIDVTLVSVAIRAVLREIRLIVSNLFLVALNVLLLRSRILALRVRTTGEQTCKSKCEHTSADYEFCFHKSLLLSYSWSHHHTYEIKHQARRKVSAQGVKDSLACYDGGTARNVTTLLVTTYGASRGCH